MVPAILGLSIVLGILLITLLILVSASEDREGAIASKAKHWLTKFDLVFPMILILSAATAGTAFSIFLNLYEKGKPGRDEYFSNLAVELGGIAYELLIVGAAFAWYERRKKRIKDEEDRIEQEAKERLAEIAILKSTIDKYIPLKNDQAKIEIMHAVKRLNELGVFDINLNRADLEVINVSKNDNNIRKIILRNGRFTDTKFDGLNLHESEFIDCVASDFSFSSASEIEAARSMFMLNVKFNGSHLQNGTFTGAYLNGASFKNVIFSGKTDFQGANLKGVSFDGVSGIDLSFHRAIVGENFLTELMSWKIARQEFFKGYVLLSWRHIVERPRLRSDIRFEYLLIDRNKFDSITDILYKEKPFRYAILDAEKPAWIDPLEEEN